MNSAFCIIPLSCYVYQTEWHLSWKETLNKLSIGDITFVSGHPPGSDCVTHSVQTEFCFFIAQYVAQPQNTSRKPCTVHFCLKAFEFTQDYERPKIRVSYDTAKINHLSFHLRPQMRHLTLLKGSLAWTWNSNRDKNTDVSGNIGEKFRAGRKIMFFTSFLTESLSDRFSPIRQVWRILWALNWI